MMYKLLENIGLYILVVLSTLLVSSVILQMLVGTATLMVAKIIDHYFRGRVISIIDRIIASRLIAGIRAKLKSKSNP